MRCFVCSSCALQRDVWFLPSSNTRQQIVCSCFFRHPVGDELDEFHVGSIVAVALTLEGCCVCGVPFSSFPKRLNLCGAVCACGDVFFVLPTPCQNISSPSSGCDFLGQRLPARCLSVGPHSRVVLVADMLDDMFTATATPLPFPPPTSTPPFH